MLGVTGRDAPGRNEEPRMSIESDPLSPELALVCPDLAARARAALPDRPWEIVHRRRAPTDDDDVPASTPAVVLEATGAFAPPVWHHPVGYPVPGPSSGQRAIVVSLLALAAVLALSIRPVPDAPVPVVSAAGTPDRTARATATPETAPAGSTRPATSGKPTPGAKQAAPAPSSASRAPRSAKSATGTVVRPAPGTTRRTPAPATPQATPKPPAATRPVVRVRPLPGGYVFGSELRLLVGASRSTIVRFDAITPCGSSVTFTQIPIAKDGTFAVRGQVAQRGGRAVVRLSGRVSSARKINGNLAASGPGCERVRRYAAVLS